MARLLDSLDQIDQIILNDPGDVPAVRDFLAVLTTLSAYDTSILVPKMGIDTANGCAAFSISLLRIGGPRNQRRSGVDRNGRRRPENTLDDRRSL